MANTPVVNVLTIVPGVVRTDPANIVTYSTSQARFMQIMCSCTGGGVYVYLNGLSTPFRLGDNETQVFNKGDVDISQIAFVNWGGSGAQNATITVIAGIYT